MLLQLDLIRISVCEKRVKNSQRRKSVSLVVLDEWVAHWHGTDLKILKHENGNNVESGPYCPVNVETKYLS